LHQGHQEWVGHMKSWQPHHHWLPACCLQYSSLIFEGPSLKTCVFSELTGVCMHPSMNTCILATQYCLSVQPLHKVVRSSVCFHKMIYTKLKPGEIKRKVTNKINLLLQYLEWFIDRLSPEQSLINEAALVSCSGLCDISMPKCAQDESGFIYMFMLFGSMGWDHVSEVQPQTGLLFIPQMIYVWGAMVEWYWQGKTKERGKKNLYSTQYCPYTYCDISEVSLVVALALL
jgi:hypothetical protein